MEITPLELRDVEIAEAFRGYNREVVNDLLERAAASIDASNARLDEVTERLKSAQLEADRSRETEDILHRTLLLAQRAADEAVAEAQQKAREMMEEAELESHKLLADAQSEAQRRRDEERARAEDEVVDLAARRDTLLADVDVLTQFESEYRAQILRVLESDLEMLRDRKTSLPGPVPQTHEVEMPVAAEAFARSETPATSIDTATDTGSEPDAQTEPGAGAFVDHDATPAADDGGDAEGDAPMTETETETETDAAPDPSVTDFFGGPETSRAVANDVGPETREVDMTALFDADAPEAEAYAAPVPFESPGSTPAPEHASATDTAFRTESSTETDVAPEGAMRDTGFDMLRPDVLDAEVLDDDAFFATLREAVQDDSPLGPRDKAEEDNEFYGDDGDKSSFRDVFRRRR